MLAAVASQMKYEAENFNTEVTLQVALLSGVNKDVSRTELKLVKIDSRLSRTIAAMDTKYLCIALVVEVVVVILLIVF